jgi:hypothetical protein
MSRCRFHRSWLGLSGCLKAVSRLRLLNHRPSQLSSSRSLVAQSVVRVRPPSGSSCSLRLEGCDERLVRTRYHPGLSGAGLDGGDVRHRRDLDCLFLVGASVDLSDACHCPQRSWVASLAATGHHWHCISDRACAQVRQKSLGDLGRQFDGL